jgi:hypothetical protein
MHAYLVLFHFIESILIALILLLLLLMLLLLLLICRLLSSGPQELWVGVGNVCMLV